MNAFTTALSNCRSGWTNPRRWDFAATDTGERDEFVLSTMFYRKDWAVEDLPLKYGSKSNSSKQFSVFGHYFGERFYLRILSAEIHVGPLAEYLRVGPHLEYPKYHHLIKLEPGEINAPEVLDDLRALASEAETYLKKRESELIANHVSFNSSLWYDHCEHYFFDDLRMLIRNS